MKTRWAEFALGCCLLLGVPAWAAISLDTDPTILREDSSLEMRLRVTHSGDEPAFDLNVVALIGDEHVSLGKRDILEPGDTWELSRAGEHDPGDGHRPVWYTVRYTDGRGYALGAIGYCPTMSRPPPKQLQAPIALSTSVLQLNDDGELVVDVAGRVDRPIQLRLMLPPGLESDVSTVMLSEGVNGQTLRFPVTNRSGLSGSRYQIFVSAEYQLEDYPTHQILRGRVDVVRGPEPDYSRWALGLPAILLVLITLDVLWLRRVEDVRRHRWVCGGAFVCWVAFFFCYFPPSLLFLDTMAVGGDTPAHLYLSSCFK